MKIYLAYKQTWIDKNKLKQELSFLKEILEQNWKNKVFIYFFDWDSNLPPEKLNNNFLNEIETSDLIVWYINYPEKSEWQLLELWMAYALNKKILILINNSVKDKYYLVYWLGKVINFKNLIDLKKLLNNQQLHNNYLGNK